MLKIFAAATLAASLAFGAIGASEPTSQGHTDVNRAAKGDRLPLPQTKSDCPQGVWPHYETSCLQKNRQPESKPTPDRHVRVVSLDRLPSITVASAKIK